jgi:hypothetical protein
MGIIHDGVQGGVGRKDWNADQKARHFGVSNRNRVALAVLDAAEAMGLISKEERDIYWTLLLPKNNSRLAKCLWRNRSATPASVGRKSLRVNPGGTPNNNRSRHARH